ncbi:ral-GDS-related protein-like isoform X1 [Ursus arctos]|uniref:ral-GDS-related protein-like isoform X1 n=1 Tax=Ursus arctos TaxID=9644 RepID=UPI0025465938|nr:ral-GDS-related protein-like isoform X1 [Ursus arctos]
MLRLREGTMEHFVQSLVPSFPDGSISTTSTIFCMYEMFTSATQVPGQQFNSTLSPFLGTWPDQNLQAIYQSLGCDRVEIKVDYVHGAMVLKWHAWDLTNHVPLLLMQRELLALTEAEVEVPAPGLLPAAEPGTGPPIELEATPALCQLSPAVSEPASPPSAVPELQPVLPSSACVPGAEQQSAGPPFLLESFTQATATEPTAAPEASCHRCVTPKNQLGEEKPDLLDFPPRLVAEQLTYMDAVSSWALRVGQGQAFLLLSPAPHLPFPDVDSYGLGPNLSSTTSQPCQPIKALSPKLSLSSCGL